MHLITSASTIFLIFSTIIQLPLSVPSQPLFRFHLQPVFQTNWENPYFGFHEYDQTSKRFRKSTKNRNYARSYKTSRWIFYVPMGESFLWNVFKRKLISETNICGYKRTPFLAPSGQISFCAQHHFFVNKWAKNVWILENQAKCKKWVLFSVLGNSWVQRSGPSLPDGIFANRKYQIWYVWEDLAMYTFGILQLVSRP
jgi:hypothetical protein